jgi:hypothetical protein
MSGRPTKGAADEKNRFPTPQPPSRRPVRPPRRRPVPAPRRRRLRVGPVGDGGHVDLLHAGRVVRARGKSGPLARRQGPLHVRLFRAAPSGRARLSGRRARRGGGGRADGGARRFGAACRLRAPRAPLHAQRRRLGRGGGYEHVAPRAESRRWGERRAGGGRAGWDAAAAPTPPLPPSLPPQAPPSNCTATCATWSAPGARP